MNERMVKLAELWERTSARGTHYFSVFMGDAQLLMFEAGEREHPNTPGETVRLWRVFVQERDPARRPPSRSRRRERRSRSETVSTRIPRWSATPSAEDRAEMPRECCRALGAVPARFDDGAEYLQFDLPVPGLTIEALVHLLRRTMEAGVPLMAFSVPGGSEV